LFNESLNWASYSGIFLILIWIPAITSGVFRIWFTLGRRAEPSPKVILRTFFIVFLTTGRAFCIPIAGGILFFQGSKLDPVLQFGQLLLVAGIAVEIIPTLINDYQRWKSGVVKDSSIISEKIQPSDK
tara:strand:+ start:1044 stop:1427 length:384 start_codon:yes stop_codon:yes gene_type:complete